MAALIAAACTGEQPMVGLCWTSDLLCDGLQGDEANAPGPSLLISYVCFEIIHVCCVMLLLQGNKVPLHRDHNWDIFGILLEDHEVCAAV
jgi:hypothetical protein